MSVDTVEMDVSGAVGGGTNHGGTSPGGPAGRRCRNTNRAYHHEEQALTDISKAAEAKLAQRRNARAEARKIRMLELEKQQKEADEQMDKEFNQEQEAKKNMLTKQAAQVVAGGSVVSASSSGSGSRRGSTESIDNDILKGSTNSGEVAPEPPKGGIDSHDVEMLKGSTNSDEGQVESDDLDFEEELQILKDALSEYEEKYKKAMMANAQLDNEKSTLIYEVDYLRDVLADQEEHMMELTREARDKHRELEAKKRENSGMKRDVDVLKEMVEQRDQLISEHGLLLAGSETDGGDGGDGAKPAIPKVGTIVVVSPEAAELLEVVGDGSLDVRLKRFVEERKQLLEQIRRLKIDLEEEKERAENAERRRANPITINGPDLEAHEVQREATKQLGEFKFKLQKAEQDVTNLGGQVVRLEGQVRRYKSSSESAEKGEAELKLEKRKNQREIQKLREKVDEIETTNSHLQKRLDKFIKRKTELS